MKTKLFLSILLSALFVMPISGAQEKKIQYKKHTKVEDSTKYDLNRFDIRAEEISNTLTIIFQGYLEEAEITVTDKDGNLVIQQGPVNIFDGMALQLCTPNAYPYYIVVDSPTLEVTGEITSAEE